MHDSVRYMLENDAFSRWLGIEVLHSSPNHCKLGMLVRAEMLNGFYILHGGVAVSFADSALAFAANHHATLSIVLDSTVHYPASARLDDALVAEAQLVYATKRTAVYDARVINAQTQQLILTLRGTVYKTEIPVQRKVE
jgi:acyl-CoA thioesterase